MEQNAQNSSLKDPFASHADATVFVETEPHRRALAHLRYGVKQGEGIVVLTGDEGVGKTTTAQRLRDEMAGQEARIFCLLDADDIDRDGLEAVVLTALQDAAGLDDDVEFVDALRTIAERDQSTSILIDNAEKLGDDDLDRVRRLSGLFHDGEGLVQIALVGETPLRSVLYRGEMEQLRQRVVASFHLPTLTVLETASYIRKRLEEAGRGDELSFTNSALKAIANEAGGIPASINRLAARGVAEAAKAGRKTVTEADLVVLDEAAVAPVIDDASPEDIASGADRAEVSVQDLNQAIEKMQQGTPSAPAATIQPAATAPQTSEAPKPRRPMSPHELLKKATNGQASASSEPATPAPVLRPQVKLPPAPKPDEDLWAPAGAMSELTAARLDRLNLPTYRPKSADTPSDAVETFLAETGSQLDTLRASIETLRAEVNRLDRRRKQRRERLIERIDTIKGRLDQIVGE